MAGASTCERQIAELALLAREVSDRRALRAQMLQSFGRVVPFESAVFTDFPERSQAMLGVDPSALEHVELCERQYGEYAYEIELALNVARREGGVL